MENPFTGTRRPLQTPAAALPTWNEAGFGKQWLELLPRTRQEVGAGAAQAPVRAAGTTRAIPPWAQQGTGVRAGAPDWPSHLSFSCRTWLSHPQALPLRDTEQ